MIVATVANASDLATTTSPLHKQTLDELSRLLSITVFLNDQNEMVLGFETVDQVGAWVDDMCEKFQGYFEFAVGVDEQDNIQDYYDNFRVPEPLFQFMSYVADARSTFDGNVWKHTMKKQWCEGVVKKLIGNTAKT